MAMTTNTIINTPTNITAAYGSQSNTNTSSLNSNPPTNAVSSYAVNPSASSPVLSAFFQTLSQVSNSGNALDASGQAVGQNTSFTSEASGSSTQATNPLNSNAAITAGSADAFQQFVYSLFQNLQADQTTKQSAVSTPSSSSIPTVTAPSSASTRPSSAYLTTLPQVLNSLASKVSGPSIGSTPGTLSGLQAAYATLVNSMNTNSPNTSASDNASLAAFLNQMSQNLQNQNLSSIPKTGSLLDTKA
jgi:hypothetical protein